MMLRFACVVVVVAVLLDCGLADPLSRARRSMSTSSGATCPGKTCAMPSSLVTSEQAKQIVDLHNTLRASMKAPLMRKLSWNATLANRAQALADKCKIAHEDTCLCNGVQLGQNLYVNKGSTQYRTPATGVGYYVHGWHNEIDYYNLATNTCQEGKICGHFTQLNWGTSYQVGCGIRRCKREDDPSFPFWEVFVCDYYPPGNIGGRTPFKMDGTASCSKCNEMTYAPQFAYKCENNLCDGCTKGSAGCKSNCEDTDPGFCSMFEGMGCDGMEDIIVTCPKTCGTC